MSRALKRSKTISVTSGKGGVGKTITTINFAINAIKFGFRVLILDGDLGLSNVDVCLGVRARYSIKDVLDGLISLKDIIVEGPLGIHLIPSGSGISSITTLTYSQKQNLLSQSHDLENDYDIILIDTGAGISDSVMHFNNVSDEVVLVTTPEPHAMTDAYALIKVLSEIKNKPLIHLLINQSRSSTESLKVFERISDVTSKFLNINIHHLGHIPYDPEVSMRILKRNIASHDMTHTFSGQAWAQTIRRLLEVNLSRNSNQTESYDLWSRIVSPQSKASFQYNI
jgi:flagellar biosynthesis protein FlhG